MILVSSMAIQNAVHRVHLAAFPPTTLMTGNTTQPVIDAVDLLFYRADATERATTRLRLQRMGGTIACFAAGCAAAALLYWSVKMWCLAVPPLLVAAALAVLPRRDAPPRENWHPSVFVSPSAQRTKPDAGRPPRPKPEDAP
jgi:uncharacterized membrane protein YoaK (UPF0700 family)